MADLSHSYSVGKRVRGYDPDYDEHYEGVIAEVRDGSDGLMFLIVDNEAPGVFQGKRVGLSAAHWEACDAA